MLPEFQLRKHSKVGKQLVSAVWRGASSPSTCFVIISCFKTNVFDDTIKHKSDEYPIYKAQLHFPGILLTPFLKFRGFVQPLINYGN